MKTILHLILLPCLAITAFAGIKGHNDESGLTIVSARYGVGDKRIDVADLLRPLVSHGCLLLRARWGLGNPDPAPGTIKDVRIVYRVDGARKSATFRQDQDIILAPKTAGLFIVSATYGVANRRVDVTQAVRAAATEDSLQLPPKWGFGRVDAAAGTVKTVEITYLYANVLKTATFKQTEELKLPDLTGLAAPDAQGAHRDEQLKAAFLQFPLLTPATNSDGQPEFQSLSLTDPIVINGFDYYGFRFTVPRRENGEDFAWVVVQPSGYFEWDILSEKGRMDGFKEYESAPKGDYLGTRRLLPLNQKKLILQSLSGTSLKDGETYLIWCNFDDKRETLSLAFTFARLESNGTNRPLALEKALGLDRPFSQAIVNPNNHHTYRLLRSATWQDSEARAVALGGHLATVRNQAENDWILQTFSSYGGAERILWIGLSDRDKKSHFAWSSGESVSYTAWAEGEPNNAGQGEDFVAMYYYPFHDQRGKWNDLGDRSLSPRGLPMNGVVEIIPQK